jgi:dTDP-4-dehydrorhamnose 3,5-epimerase
MIEGVEIKRLKVITDDRGYLMEMLRSDDELFEKFGQVYLTVCNPGYVKGWHYHKKQTDNFIVIKGNAKVVLYDMRETSKTKSEIQEIFMGENNHILLKIPTLVMHGITPTNDEQVYLINCPTEKYDYDDPDEFRIDFKSKKIPYDWGVSKGG